jgi:hypothetical protein
MKKTDVIKDVILILFVQLSRADKKELMDSLVESAKLIKADAE